MDSINDLLGSVLNNPDSMQKLRETARQLGLDTSESSPSGEEQTALSANTSDSLSGLNATINKLVPLLGKLNEEDDMSRLIHALKPYLSGARLKRAEEADRIVSIMRVIPLLKQSRQEEQSI